MAISILNYYEQPDGKNLMIMADDLYEGNPGKAPDDNMPMDPTNYAISQNLGVPADGSITIVRDFDEDKKVKTVTNVFNEGEWKNSTESGGSGEQSGAIKIIERSIKEVSDEDLKGITKIGNYAFYHYTGLTSITIPNSVTSIGDYAFSDCTGLTSITIPESVTSIDASAFRDCKSLTSVTIPNSVTSIGSSAFRGCTGLTSITIPDSVTSSGSSAFDGCTGLQAVYISDIAKWCGISFNSYLSNPISSHHSNLYLNGTLVTDLIIPDGVTSIKDYVFYYCSSLQSITIPDSVTSIGKQAFYRSGLNSITIPDSVTSVGDNAFGACYIEDIYYIGNQSSFVSISGVSHLTGLGATIHFIGKTESYNNVETRTESNATGTTLYITTNSSTN